MDLLFGNLKAKLDGTVVIKAYAREPEEIAEFALQLDDAHVPRVQETQLGAAFSNLSGAIGGVGTALGVRGRGVRGAPGPADARPGRRRRRPWRG